MEPSYMYEISISITIEVDQMGAITNEEFVVNELKKLLPKDRIIIPNTMMAFKIKSINKEE